MIRVRASSLVIGICIVLLLLSSVPAVSAEGGYTYTAQWNLTSIYAKSGSIGFFYPGGIAVDRSDRVYFAVRGGTDSDRLVRVLPDGSLDDIVVPRYAPSYLSDYFLAFSPVDIAVDRVGNIYGTNSWARDVVMFSPRFGQSYYSDYPLVTRWGGIDTGDGEFQAPGGIAVDGAGTVYVADATTNLVQTFTASGTYRAQWGGTGTGNGKFNGTAGVAVDGAGNVYVVDSGNNRVQKFSSSGGYLAQWGGPGSSNGTFNAPSGIAVDRAGNVYVADTGNDRVQKFDPSGRFLTKWGSHGTGNGQFDHPGSLGVDSAGTVYVADVYNNRFQKFAPGPARSPDFLALPYAGFAPLEVRFSDTTPGSPTSWRWDFGDGTNATVKNPTHVYGSPGVYSVSLTAAGGTMTRTGLVVVSAPFEADFSMAPPTGVAPLDVQFTDTSTGSPIGWYWDFGDGTHSRERNPSHRYEQIGDYTVTMRVIGANSLCDIASHQVEATTPPVPEYRLAGQWGRSAPGSGFITPVDVAVDRGGNHYVLDECSDWVWKYSPNGTLLARWGGSGSGPGQLHGPSGIAVDNTTGAVYVADPGNQRIQKFTSTGAPAPEWNRTGAVYPNNYVNVAVDGAGNVYAVEDDPNPHNYYIDDEVWKFDPSGQRLMRFDAGPNEGYESERETFHHSRGLAVDPAGTVHVIDGFKSQVRSFAPNGTYLREWQIGRSPTDIAVDRAGTLYISTHSISGNPPDIRKFSSTGSLLAQWGTEGTANGQLGYPRGLAVDSTGNVYVADDHSTFHRDWASSRVQKFSPTGGYLAKWACSGFGDGQFADPHVAVDPAGYVYVADPVTDRVQKFDASGKFLAKWGSHGTGDGQFDGPYGIAVDRTGNVYVADRGNDRVQKFDANGKFLKRWGGTGTGNGQFDGPYRIAADRAGFVYVLDSRIQKFDANGTFVLKWGDGQFGGLSSVDMTTDPAGYVYVTKHADTGSGQVVKYASNGTQVGALPFGDWPDPPWVYGIAVDAAGMQYWTSHTPDAYLGVVSAVSVVSKEGVLLATLGGSGSGGGEGWFDYPRDIAIDDAGSLYVADSGNHRIQKFVRAGPAPVALPSASGAPTDTDGDGIYDDVNGNGRADFADVVLYFNQMTWIADNEPLGAVDYNGNGRIDFADVVWLFNNL